MQKEVISDLKCLKVDGNEKWAGWGKNTVNQFLSAIVAIGGYFKFERVLSL
jgi:hypothetical protein